MQRSILRCQSFILRNMSFPTPNKKFLRRVPVPGDAWMEVFFVLMGVDLAENEKYSPWYFMLPATVFLSVYFCENCGNNNFCIK